MKMPFRQQHCDFEILGYMEYLIDALTKKWLGSRDIQTPDRPTGSVGMLEYNLTEDVVLKRGHNTITIRASTQKPVRVIGTIQIKCGRVKGI